MSARHGERFTAWRQLSDSGAAWLVDLTRFNRWFTADFVIAPVSAHGSDHGKHT
jgi:hypothetical protein